VTTAGGGYRGDSATRADAPMGHEPAPPGSHGVTNMVAGHETMSLNALVARIEAGNGPGFASWSGPPGDASGATADVATADTSVQ
jgi:hypothetical protein